MIDGKKMILTLDDGIFCPDGFMYWSVLGRVKIFPAEAILGFQPKGAHANWYVEVSGETEKMYIGGCRIVKSLTCNELEFNPSTNKVTTLNKDGNVIDFFYPSIYVLK